jgi:DNA helicase-2/ATP-dependent DNA helicase PcrA
MAACFPDEVDHLDTIKKKLCDAFKRSDETVQAYEAEYRESKSYLAHYRHEIDPKEIFVNELSIQQIERLGNFAVRTRDRIAKLLDSPYFARIDFRYADEDEDKAFYIGRFSFDEGRKTLIYDWRAPVSNMFYDCELGHAAYEAPAGRLEGELTRERQFRVRHGQMEYALESSMHIQDDVLQRELSHTSDEKMRTIIATIQKEQNSIIRNAKADTLVIQGVAGSGKTSIALHRIAYLLYRNREQLAAQNVVIISPNKVFSDYISGVLPELGEEPVWEMGFADIAAIQLNGIIGFEREKDPNEADGAEWIKRARFKSSCAFVTMMDEYLSDITASCFEPSDYVFGCFKVPGQWIDARYRAYRDMPVKKRLEEVADDLMDRLETDNARGEELPARRAVLKELTGMLKINNTLALYRDFYRKTGAPEMLALPDKKTLEWADVYPFLYFHGAFEGLKANRLAKHLVIDEMQDYTPVQYAVINRLFTCKKTILGDFGQSVRPYHSFALEDFKKLYDRPDIVTLTKSYRSTYEIMAFAKKILDISALEPVERHGERPDIIRCGSPEEELLKIKEKLDAFKSGPYITLGIILKTQARAEALYRALSKDYEAHLLTPESEAFANGISVASVGMSKGLEFDEVVIPSADSGTYHTGGDRHLLYIACTRAMHRLSLIYSGERTGLIKEGI